MFEGRLTQFRTFEDYARVFRLTNEFADLPAVKCLPRIIDRMIVVITGNFPRRIVPANPDLQFYAGGDARRFIFVHKISGVAHYMHIRAVDGTADFSFQDIMAYATQGNAEFEIAIREWDKDTFMLMMSEGAMDPDVLGNVRPLFGWSRIKTLEFLIRYLDAQRLEQGEAAAQPIVVRKRLRPEPESSLLFRKK